MKIRGLLDQSPPLRKGMKGIKPQENTHAAADFWSGLAQSLLPSFSIAAFFFLGWTWRERMKVNCNAQVL
jgi:hypothetical protein